LRAAQPDKKSALNTKIAYLFTNALWDKCTMIGFAIT